MQVRAELAPAKKKTQLAPAPALGALIAEQTRLVAVPECDAGTPKLVVMVAGVHVVVGPPGNNGMDPVPLRVPVQPN